MLVKIALFLAWQCGQWAIGGVDDGRELCGGDDGGGDDGAIHKSGGMIVVMAVIHKVVGLWWRWRPG